MSIETSNDEKNIVRAVGEIDLSNVTELDTALSKVACASRNGIILDLSDATYIDSAGVQSILNAYKIIRDSGDNFAIIVKTKSIIDLLHVMRLDMLPGLALCDDISSAKKFLSKKDTS